MKKNYQVSFFMSSIDLKAFDEHLCARKDAAVIRIPLPQESLVLIPSLYPIEQGEWLTRFVTTRDLLDEVKTKFVPNKGYWLIDELLSPVIEVGRCYVTEKAIRRGRLYLIGSYTGNDGNEVDKPARIVHLGRSLIQWIRTNYIFEASTQSFIGPDANIRRQEGNCEFLLN